MPQPLGHAVLAKLQEQIERTTHLIRFLPENALEWTPPIERPWTTGRLLGHIIACLGGVCSVLYAIHPDRLAHFQELRKLLPSSELDLDQLVGRIRLFADHIAEGFEVLEDGELGRKIPTVFVPDGEPVLTLLLGNLEHIINHKHQLFMYLRLLNVPVESCDLYRFRS